MPDPSIDPRRTDAALAALRRVSMLVAGGARPAEVFTGIACEAAGVLGVGLVALWRYEPDGSATVIASSGDGERAYAAGTRWTLERVEEHVVAPIMVDGDTWGAMSAEGAGDELLARLADFTDLVAATFSTTARQEELARLAEEQAALRRVATLVAEGVPAAELFAVVTEQVGRLFDVDAAATIHYESDTMVTAVGSWTADGVQAATEVGRRFPLDGESLAPRILSTGLPARIDDWGAVAGPIAEYSRDRLGVRSSVGSPILVEGRVWGNVAVHSTTGPLPPDTEDRIARFTDLVATAILNAQARADVQRLADEQAALRRVATLIAREREPSEVFAAVAEELSRLLSVADAAMLRFENERLATVVAIFGSLMDTVPIGTPLPVRGQSVTAIVRDTLAPARIDDYETASGLGGQMHDLGVQSAVGVPIVVDGRLWGVMIAAHSRPEPLPPDTEARVAQFTALIATALANVQARADLAASRARIVQAADDERRRVVRDLHDGAQQRLVHTVVTLKLALRALEGDSESNDVGSPTELVGDALAQAEQATVEIRELALGMLPTVLTRGGLRAAVDALASQLNVPVLVDVVPERLPSAIEATAYFVVSESLTNVVKHARASQVQVTGVVEDDTLRLSVRDDGAGGAQATGGRGLVGLRDRLGAVEGRLRIASPPGGGTEIVATIPLGEATASAHDG